MSSSGYYSDGESSWEISPIIKSQNSNTKQTGNPSIVDTNRKNDGRNGGNLISSKQIFNGLACLLVASLCLLLVELRQPGVAHRAAKSIYNKLFYSSSSSSISTNAGHYPHGNYSPVPAPFLTPPRLAADGDYNAPTSEPTILIGHLRGADPHMENSPTSEPTEYRDVQELGVVYDHPTMEPTLFNERLPGVNDHDPTSEPTIFFSSTGEGGEPSSSSSSSENVPTVEPTIFGQSNEPTIFGMSSEPTVFGQQSNEPTMFDLSGEPTVFGLTGEPTSFTNGISAEPTVFGDHVNIDAPTNGNTGEHSTPTTEPTVFGAHDIPRVNTPTAEPTTFSERNIPGVGVPTLHPSQPPNLNTWGPTSFISVAPTSDPTIFPTPEPTAGE